MLMNGHLVGDRRSDPGLRVAVGGIECMSQCAAVTGEDFAVYGGSAARGRCMFAQTARDVFRNRSPPGMKLRDEYRPELLKDQTIQLISAVVDEACDVGVRCGK